MALIKKNAAKAAKPAKAKAKAKTNPAARVAKGTASAAGKAAKAAASAAGKATSAAATAAVAAAKDAKAKPAKPAKPNKPAKPSRDERRAAKTAAQQAKADARAIKKSGPSDVDIMTARLFFTAAFPTMQVLLDDDPKLHEKFAKVNKTIQFGAKYNGGLLCCTMKLNNGTITSEEGPAAKPDLKLTFGSVQQMNALLKGGLAVPAIKGSKKLLADFLPLMLGLNLMTKPNDKLKNDAEKLLKVKMSLYMITRALSKYNKLGDPDMQEFCLRQPERIYQFSVDDGGEKDVVACYFRVAEGKSKSGHGVYTRRTPFVLFHFLSIDGALKVLGSECEFVEGVEKGYVETIGSPEYACYLNDYMAIIQGMMM